MHAVSQSYQSKNQFKRLQLACFHRKLVVITTNQIRKRPEFGKLEHYFRTESMSCGKIFFRGYNFGHVSARKCFRKNVPIARSPDPWPARLKHLSKVKNSWIFTNKRNSWIFILIENGFLGTFRCLKGTSWLGTSNLHRSLENLPITPHTDFYLSAPSRFSIWTAERRDW